MTGGATRIFQLGWNQPPAGEDVRKDDKVDIQRTRNKLTGPKKQNSYILIRKKRYGRAPFSFEIFTSRPFRGWACCFFSSFRTNKFLGFFWGYLGWLFTWNLSLSFFQVFFFFFLWKKSHQEGQGWCLVKPSSLGSFGWWYSCQLACGYWWQSR